MTDAAADSAPDVLPSKTDAAMSSFTDGQIFQILHAFNASEVTEADTADMSTMDPGVRTLSSGYDLFYTEVDGMLVQFAARVNLMAAASAQATAISAMGTADETHFATLSGAAFDSAWLSTQISEQQSMLTLIDSMLVPSVSNPDFAGVVQTERDQVASNLASAQRLMGTLDTGTSDGGTSSDAAGDH
jgi:hypothetical protein